MAFISSLNQDDYTKKPGDLIRSADWNALGNEVVNLGKAKLDRDGDTLEGELKVNGPLRVSDEIEAKQLVIHPAAEGETNKGLQLGTESDFGIYRADAGSKKSLAGKTAVAGDNFSGQALRIRSGLDANSGFIIENQQEQLNFSVRASDGATFVRGALRIGGSELRLNGQGGGVGNNNNAARALLDGGPSNGLVINFGNDFGKVSVQSDVQVKGAVQAEAFTSSNPMIHRMYPAKPLVYQNIFDAVREKAIMKLGKPAYYDDTSYATALWGDLHIIAYGGNGESDGNGAVVEIPEGYDTLWLRVLGERWNSIKAYFLDGDTQELGFWTGGWRGLNSCCPDGTLTDASYAYHQWVAIPVGRAGKVALISKSDTSNSFWLSGLGFSNNPWAHATQAAVSYHWGLNGSEVAGWDTHNWNSDQSGYIQSKTNWALRVPVVPSGRDKLLFIVEINNNWSGGMHTGIRVNDEPIERFVATYDNPFARHWNSKFYCRYLAACIPASLISDKQRFLKVQIDMSKQDNHIYFREIGTHDRDVPTVY